MNANVKAVGEQIIGLYHEQRVALETLTARELVELEHEMEHLRNHPTFSIRTASEIVRTAAKMSREAKIDGQHSTFNIQHSTTNTQ